MKWSNFFSLLQSIPKGELEPIYLVQGNGIFQVSELVAEIKKRLFGSGDNSSEWNFDSFLAEELSAEKLSESLETLPGLFSGADSKRLVVCYHAEKLNAGCISVLEKYFKNPSDSSCFVIHGEKLDGRKAWVKAGQPYLVEVRPPYDREWPQWKDYFEQKLGKSIENGGWQRLIECFGKDLSVLYSECVKLALYVGKAKTITLKEVDLFVSTPMEEDLFRLIDHVLARDGAEALRSYQRIASSIEDQNRLIALWIRQLKILQECNECLEQGITDAKIVGPRIGVSPFFVSKTIQQTKGLTKTALKQATHRLAEVDYRAKTGQGFFLWEEFISPLIS